MWGLLGLMNLGIHFSPKLGKFLVIIALNMLSFSFSSSEIPIMPILFPSIVSYKLHILSSLFTFFVFYYICFSDWIISNVLSSRSSVRSSR